MEDLSVFYAIIKPPYTIVQGISTIGLAMGVMAYGYSCMSSSEVKKIAQAKSFLINSIYAWCVINGLRLLIDVIMAFM